MNAMLQARATMKAVLDHVATPTDLQVLVRIALYCNEMCVKMINERSVESDGLADVAEAVTSGMTAVNSIIDRFNKSERIGTSGPERAPLEGLIDAYEALFSTATRRESAAALAKLPGAI